MRAYDSVQVAGLAQPTNHVAPFALSLSGWTPHLVRRRVGDVEGGSDCGVEATAGDGAHGIKRPGQGTAVWSCLIKCVGMIHRWCVGAKEIRSEDDRGPVEPDPPTHPMATPKYWLPCAPAAASRSTVRTRRAVPTASAATAWPHVWS